jgi:hypothetical protein
MTYGVVRAFQVIVNTLSCTEKAGVGGSTPSLATIIPKNLVEIQSLALVRSQSAFTRGIEECLRNCMMLNNLGQCNFWCSPLSVRFGPPRG